MYVKIWTSHLTPPGYMSPLDTRVAAGMHTISVAAHAAALYTGKKARDDALSVAHAQVVQNGRLIQVAQFDHVCDRYKRAFVHRVALFRGDLLVHCALLVLQLGHMAARLDMAGEPSFRLVATQHQPRQRGASERARQCKWPRWEPRSGLLSASNKCVPEPHPRVRLDEIHPFVGHDVTGLRAA
eukprot:COSAG02_NODE_1825_length_10759_cov_5327.807317_5_plen_183_part_01